MAVEATIRTCNKCGQPIAPTDLAAERLEVTAFNVTAPVTIAFDLCGTDAAALVSALGEIEPNRPSPT